MTLAITHTAVVVTADDGTSEVGSNEWNAPHTLTGTVSIAQGGTNATSFTSNALDYFDGTSIASMAGTSWDNTNRSLTLTGATVTASNPILNLSQTWNNAAVAFTALKLNVTNTASANGSGLLDLQVGGTSKLSFGIVQAGTQYVLSLGPLTNASYGFRNLNSKIEAVLGDASAYCDFKADNLTAATDLFLGGNTSRLLFGQSFDIILTRDAAGILAQRNSTNAQTLRVYNTYTDASNYERINIGWTANVATITSSAAGTGTARDLNIGSGGVTNIDNGAYTTLRASGTLISYVAADGLVAGADNSLNLGRAALRYQYAYIGTTTVASLPAAAANIQGARTMVTNANSNTFYASVVAATSTSTAQIVPVFCTGAAWLIG